MARLEYIRYQPHRFSYDGEVKWKTINHVEIIEKLPQIIWNDGTPWRAANLWALERATSFSTSIKTVQSNLTALHAYGNWLEAEEVDWWNFPARKSDRCLIRYRGALIAARNEGKLAPSTVSQRMASVVQFYKWLLDKKFFENDTLLWSAKTIGVKTNDEAGFKRTVLVNSVDLSIPNRVRPGEKLEDGLLPVTIHDRDSILILAKKNFSEEFFLMLSLGFFTGMRL